MVTSVAMDSVLLEHVTCNVSCKISAVLAATEIETTEISCAGFVRASRRNRK